MLLKIIAKHFARGEDKIPPLKARVIAVLAIKIGVSCHVNIFYGELILHYYFCRTIYFNMLSMQHSSKQELNTIFFLHHWWFPRGIHGIRYMLAGYKLL